MAASFRTPSTFPHTASAMSERVRAHDWAATPLGPIDGWPEVLRVAAQMVLASQFPKCLVWGPAMTAIYNDAFRTILGGKPDVLGEPFYEIWAEAWETIRPIAERALAGESMYYEDFPLRVQRGGQEEQAYFTFCYSPVHDGAGNVAGFMDTVIETTGKFTAQQRLKELASSLEQQVADRTADRNRLWLLSDAMLVVARLDGTIAAVNPAWQATLGYSEDETLGRRVLSFLHGEEATRVPHDVQRLAEAAQRHQATLCFRHKSGAVRWIDWTAVPGDGFVQAVGRDVTDERARTEALLQSQDRVRHSQKMEAIGQLTGGIAHDFNNMLQGVVLPLQLIGQRHARGHMDDIPRYVEAGLASARRAAALTQRLLAFSRRQPLDVRPVDVGGSIRSLESMLRNTCGENISLAVEIPAELWPVLTDAHQLESAVLNLAINARDAMPEGGELRINGDNLPDGGQGLTAHEREAMGLPAGELVRVQVCDTGHGMSKEVLELAFDPFFTTKPLGQGTGLGLSMIYGYMRQSGGAVAIDSTVGEGTCVSLYFPRSQQVVAEDVPEGLESAAADKRPDSILVVEDDATVREFVCELLRDLGFQVMSAGSGAEGMAMLSGALHFDLLVSDVGLPGPNGRQVADFARERLPQIHVLLMTGYAEQAAMDPSFLVAHQMELIVKPFDAQALVHKVLGMVGSPKG
ncbi:hybrid sensor histidine kinase/response regulator [Acidovorax sp. NCPPB 4044]|uniref:hybrid sensor histidine kinase/response regulator n=1 Tax=Acidovorax sp. NCPPB 4044 TaxID=2940490 RepID=UPI00230323AB|nr:PAS domain-containing sensor histidine kinase [Acidovorax sp. NCPPB 4044]MDA8521167.1 PAS domain-containing protein [Acidovorax sp. NCPPB 4044]